MTHLKQENQIDSEATISQNDWDAGLKIARLFQLQSPSPPSATTQAKKSDDPPLQSILPAELSNKEQKFTGFSDKKKKGASSGKKKHQKKQSFVPLLFFDEDSEGNIVPREVGATPVQADPPQQQTGLAELDQVDKSDDKQMQQQNAETPEKSKTEKTTAKKSHEDQETGRLSQVPVVSYYGASLNDAARVARFNDFRAFQLILESKFDTDECFELDKFLQKEKERRTKVEALEYYEKRMDTIDHDFVYSEFQKQVKRLEQQQRKAKNSGDKLLDLFDACKVQDQNGDDDQKMLDEDELGSTEPEALKLDPKDFKEGKDYVLSYVRETRKLHASDAKNEIRRRESLGYSFKTQNLQPRAMRLPLVDKNFGKKLVGPQYHVTAIIPILKETYKAKFNGTKKPRYTRIQTDLMGDSHVLGILTASGPVGQIPPVTICEQFNDLRADENANCVYTYAFANLDAEKMQAEISDPQKMVAIMKEQEFEKEHNNTKSLKRAENVQESGFDLPNAFSIDDLVEFNRKVLGQQNALQNPSLFQPGVKAEPLDFDLKTSSKNYLLIPMKKTKSDRLVYEIDSETILAFADKGRQSRHTLNKLSSGCSQVNLENDVFFSRFDPHLCFQVTELISAEESLRKPVSCVNESPSKSNTFSIGGEPTLPKPQSVKSSSAAPGQELTTLQRVLRQVYGRTNRVSETQSLSEFLFKKDQSVTAGTKQEDNSAWMGDSNERGGEEVGQDAQSHTVKAQQPYTYQKGDKGGTRKLKVVELMRESINKFVSNNPNTASYKDFSKASVAIVREARQLPDANNLQKRYTFKLSPLGPNPNGQHTVNAKRQNLKQNEPGNFGYTGLSMLSSEALCRHFMNFECFTRTFGALPHLLNFLERGCLLNDANEETFAKNQVGQVVPEFMLWACTGNGVDSTRRSYEVLETYGDTILKLAATLLAYGLKRNDPKAGEGDIENAKQVFVTNFHVFRIGYHNLRMHRFMRIMRDPEAKDWIMPLQGLKPRLNACPGKSLADSVEAMIGAHFLTNDNLLKTLQWISDIRLVPLEQTGVFKQMQNIKSSTFEHLKSINLRDLPFSRSDDLKTLFTKYFEQVPAIQESCSQEELAGSKQRFFALIDSADGVGTMGQNINAISHLHGQMFQSQALRRLQKLQREVLDYEFNEPLLLLEAVTHKSAKSYFQLNFNYEKLEILGDAILDYLANGNLLRFTLFERYLTVDPDQYKFSEDFLCADAHQAKKQLVANDMIGKLCVLLGFHKYIIFYDAQQESHTMKAVEDFLNFSFTNTNFAMDESELEPFEAPKILGDVFESVMGAIFVDGGLNAVMHVYKHLVSPMLLFIAKFSKEVTKEPKEQFVCKAATGYRIYPKFFVHDAPQEMEVASKQVVPTGTVDSEGRPQFQQLMTRSVMYKCDVLYRKGKVLCTGYGSTKRQAERNAGVEGLKWLEEHPEQRKKELK